MPTDPKDIVRRPLLTEKGTMQQEHSNQFCFLVHPDANRIQIKGAIEQLFPDVLVKSVRTMVRKGKPRRRFGRTFKTPPFKRALVTLRKGDTIDFF